MRLGTTQLSWQHGQTKQKQLPKERTTETEKKTEKETEMEMEMTTAMRRLWLECAYHNGTFSQHLHAE